MSNASTHKRLRRIRGELIVLSAKLSDHHSDRLLEVAREVRSIELAYESKYLREDREKRS